MIKTIAKLALALALLTSLSSCCFGSLFDDENTNPDVHNEGGGNDV